jgi:glycosyltransferase involved in cell wall biosynthesis
VRIAYLCSDPGVPFHGASGSSVHLRETVAALRSLGHDIHVFVADTGSERGTAGVDALPLGGLAAEVASLLAREPDLPTHLSSEVRRLLHAEYLQRAVLPSLAAFEPHVLYERHSLLGYSGVELAADLGLPLVVELNAPLAQEASLHRGLVLRDTAAAVEAATLRSADAVVVVSDELARHVLGLGVRRERVMVLPNAVDVHRFHPSVSGEHLRAGLGLGGRPVIGFIGSLKGWHDLDTLVAACDLLRRRGQDVRLLAVGDGPRGAELERAGDWVVRVAAASHEQIPGYLAAMDVVVVPYAGPETYFSPLKLYEAMAAARPVVAARTGQVARVLADGATGLLYDPGDAEGLADRIEILLASPELARALGVEARKSIVASGRTWTANARRLEALLLRLVQKVAA